MWETMFRTHEKQLAEICFLILTFTFLDSRREDEDVNGILVSIPRI
jgi:hypothetical protein